MHTPDAKHSSPNHGAPLVIAASLLWAAGYLFRKTALYGISPLLLTTITAWIVALTFITIFRFSFRTLLREFLSHYWLYLSLALTGVVFGTTAMFIALDRLDLGVTLVLEKLQPIFTLLLAALFIGERIAPRAIPWMFGAILCSYFVSAREPLSFGTVHSSSTGVIAVVIAAFSWGLSSVIGKRLTKVQPDPRLITLLRFLVGALVLTPCLFFQARLGLHLEPTPYVLSVTVLCALFSSGLGFLLFYRGLKGVTATQSGFLELVTPVFGVLLGITFLGEQLTLLQLIAAAALLTCIFQLCRTRR